MKSKQMKIIASVLIILILVSFTYNNFLNKNEELVLNKEVETKTGTTALSMMYETEKGSGNYVESNESAWLGEGYTFNETLSKCEQGGILTWNEAEHKVYLSTTKSDKCYVYFDKINPITITGGSGSFGETYLKITNLTYEPSDAVISKYYVVYKNESQNIVSSLFEYDSFPIEELGNYNFTQCPRDSISALIYVVDNNDVKSNTIKIILEKVGGGLALLTC